MGKKSHFFAIFLTIFNNFSKFWFFSCSLIFQNFEWKTINFVSLFSCHFGSNFWWILCVTQSLAVRRFARDSHVKIFAKFFLRMTARRGVSTIEKPLGITFKSESVRREMFSGWDASMYYQDSLCQHDIKNVYSKPKVAKSAETSAGGSVESRN